MRKADLVVVGGGIVGLASARAFLAARFPEDASFALTLGARIICPKARCMPTSLGSVKVPPLSGMRPMLMKLWMKLVLSAASVRSQA